MSKNSAQKLQFEACQKGMALLDTLKMPIQNYYKNPDSQADAQHLSHSYLRNSIKVGDANLEKLDKNTLNKYLTIGLADSIIQMDAINNNNQKSSAKGSDFMKMIKVQKQIIKIQSVFRQKLVLARLEKDAHNQKEKLAKIQSDKTRPPEENALRELKTRLAKKGLTPEAFFRIIDSQYEKVITFEKFKSACQNFKLELSKGQIARLSLIFDEDMTETISLSEYQDTLEAYGQNGEQHIDVNGAHFYIPFEHRSLFKLLKILKSRKISAHELFGLCDVNGDGTIMVTELQNKLKSLSPDFYTKDIQVIHNFFDIDKNNTISEDEFLNQVQRAERLKQQSDAKVASLNGAVGGKDIQEEDDGINMFIPGYSMCSDSQKQDKLIEYFNTLFRQKQVNPSQIFGMAGGQKATIIKFGQLVECMEKFFSTLTPQIIQELYSQLRISESETMDRDYFSLIFKFQPKNQEVGPAPTPVKLMNQIEKTKGIAEKNRALLKYFYECIERSKITPQQLFLKVDKTRQSVIKVDELKTEIKNTLPDQFSVLNFKKLLAAFDLNGNGLIEKDEFLEIMNKISKENVDTSAYTKIALSLQGSAGFSDTQTDALKKQLEMARNSNIIEVPKLVDEEYRVTERNSLEYLKSAVAIYDKYNGKFGNAINTITGKILAWKQEHGDLEAQEVFVMQSLKPKKKLMIHNIKTATSQIESFNNKHVGKQQGLNLTSEEIQIIIFSSIDFDYLPHFLVKQGQFIQWFTTNFAGENTEENDFEADKQHDLEGFCGLARKCVTFYQKMAGDLLAQKWWRKVRYNDIAQKIIQALKTNPQKKGILRKHFADHKDKISYYDFFNEIQHDLGLNFENWEEYEVEGRLDRLGLAYFEFNQFNEFLEEYDYVWGEPVIETNITSILQAKMNLSYKNYVISESDYFQGCPTMFNNEKAAIKYATTQYQKMKKTNQKLWFDVDFGPREPKDVLGNSYGLYCDGKPPEKGYTDPEDVEWTYIDDLVKERGLPDGGKFLLGSANPSDCRQGELGDCWLISALSVLANRDELIVGGKSGLEYDNDMIIDQEIALCLSSGVYPPIFHKFRSRGIYVFRFFKNFERIYVCVDTRIPCKKATKDKAYREPIFACAESVQETWVSLIEKAYAKLHGCYGNLISGYIDEGLQELTGFQPEKIILRDEKSQVFPSQQILKNYGGIDGFWFYMMQRQSDKCLMGCSIYYKSKHGEHMIDGKPSGLLLNHAYSLLGVFEIDSKEKKGEKIRLVLLRNPWGKKEWEGAWSTNSKETSAYQSQIMKLIDQLPPSDQFDPEKNDDGFFFMNFNDWKDIFSNLFVNIDFPAQWTGIRFKSAWCTSNSPGLPTQPTPEALQLYAENPQFMIKTKETTQIMISLQQTGGRLPQGRTYFKYPFAETLIYANCAIFKIDNNEKYLQQFDPKKLVYISPIKRERENSGRCELEANCTYIIVPSAEIKGQEQDFYLSIYVSCELRDCEVKRVFHPEDPNDNQDEFLPTFIPEELEKIQVAPAWKQELVRAMIPYMMTEEDKKIKEVMSEIEE